jgi:uncharacterized protein involved in exopolysaccharide biosynthesis
MEQIAIFDVVRRHLAMIITVCIIATVTGYALCFLLPNRYVAPALVLVRPQQPIKTSESKSSKEFLGFSIGSGAAVETASKTYIAIIKSPALISEVVRQLGLDKEPEDANSGESTGFLHKLGQSLKDLTAILKYGKVIEEDRFTRAVNGVSGGLSLEATPDTYIFELKFTASDPVMAADVSNTTAKMLIKFVSELRLAESQHQLDYLRTELKQSRDQVNAARQRVESYKEAHSIFSPDREYETKIKVISDLEMELAKAEGTLVGRQNTLSRLSLAAQRAHLIRLIGERKAELTPLPEMERELKQLDQDVKDALNAYETVEKEFKDAEIKESYTMPEVQLVSPAVAPNLPSSPQRGIVAMVSLLGGLIVAISIALLLEYLNRGVRSIHDIEDFVGIKVLATIPRVLRRPT